MSEWLSIQIKELGRVVTGNTPPRAKPEYYGTHTLFVKPTDIDIDTKYTYITEEDYSKLGYEKYKNSLIPKGSSCVVTIGSIGKKITKAHCNLFINQAVNAVISNAKYDDDFVYYLLKFNLYKLKTLDSGTASGRENVSKSSFSNMRVNVPILPTQKKIAKILSNYDDLIENNLKGIKLLEESARLTYEEWFLRFRIDGKKLEIDSETGLPFGWEKKKLGNLVDFQGGYAFKSELYEIDKRYKIVTIKNVQDGLFIPETTDTISFLPDNIKDSQLLKSGDIIMSLTGNVGRVCLVYGDDYLLNQRVVNLIPKDKLDYGYLYSLFRHSSMTIQLENISNGAAQQNLSPVNAAKIKVAIPTKNTINKFHSKVNPMIDLIIKLNLQNKLLKEARDILLPRLMTGMIDVEELEVAG